MVGYLLGQLVMLPSECRAQCECDEQRDDDRVNTLEAGSCNAMKQALKGVVEVQYTTVRLGRGVRFMAFVRRKGNAFYLVHNVRRGGKVRQLHLARLGDRARITERVVREVSKKHPFV